VTCDVPIKPKTARLALLLEEAHHEKKKGLDQYILSIIHLSKTAEVILTPNPTTYTSNVASTQSESSYFPHQTAKPSSETPPFRMPATYQNTTVPTIPNPSFSILFHVFNPVHHSAAYHSHPSYAYSPARQEELHPPRNEY
jgi:hypothetical protein